MNCWLFVNGAACSFTKAAAQLGVSQLALSHTTRGPETGLGIRLLKTIVPRLEDIEAELAALSEFKDKRVVSPQPPPFFTCL